MNMTIVDSNKDTPLYLQVKDILVERIKNHVWPPSSLIPTENQLMEEFNVSRTTIRQAVSMLVNDGLLEKQQGKGTIVKLQPLVGSLGRLKGFAEEVLEKGRVPHARVLRVEFNQNLFEEKSKLQVVETGRVLIIERVRFADNMPIALERTCWPEEIGQFLTNHDLKDARYYDILEQNGVTLKRAQETISAINATIFESDLLGIRPGEALLKMSRLSFGIDDKPIEYTITKYRSDHYHYHIDLNR